jgi:hypothetical protein
MITVLRSSHPFFFIVSSIVLLIVLIGGFNGNTFFLTDGHPLYILHFIPKYFQFIIGLLLLFYSGFLINNVVNKSVLFAKNFYLPGLIYISLMVFFSENSSLHPMAISNLFCILGFGNLIKIYRNESCKNHVFKACCWIILALICYPSFSVLFLISWLSLLIIRPFVWKEYLIPVLCLGLFAAYLSVSLLLLKSPFNVLPNWLSSISFYNTPFTHYSMIAIGVFIFITLSLSLKIILFIYGRSTNRFKKVIKLLLIFFVLSVVQMAMDVFIFKSNCLSIYSSFVPLSILISFVFMYSKKVWIVDSLYVLFILSIFVFTYLI